jgi:hypothetical protein
MKKSHFYYLLDICLIQFIASVTLFFFEKIKLLYNLFAREFLFILDTSNIWIQDLQKSNPAVHRLPKLDYFSAIRLVKWSREDTLVVITADSTVYNIEFDYDSDFKNVSCKFPELQQSDLSSVTFIPEVQINLCFSV